MCSSVCNLHDAVKNCDGVRLFGGGWEAGEMEDGGFPVRKWEDLNIDILVRIFQSFDIFELTSGIAHVCSAWRLACCDPLLWKKLDLSMLKSNFIKIPLEPYVYVDGRSDKTLTRILKTSLSLSKGNIMTLVFHFNLFVSDDQLTYTAERCPQLKRLVMPAWNRIKKTGICKAIRCWKELESLTMPSIANPPYLLEEIKRNCKNFSELKIMGPCDIFFASTLVEHLPKLKVLSLRCSTLLKDVLIMILDRLEHLEVLNISHCLLIETPPPPATRRLVRQLDPLILEKASRLQRFLTCMQDSCVMCQRTKNDEGIMRWYKYEEGLWKEDEVSSLAC
ncbi:F-box/LRR-repeat protein At3g48880-like isoform X2 [Pyrus communis]|uniref:F-box/LRR-repeat protein At3g48880-like isoform X2 n=1 Tax=Pyrus communis TaxID=23211 RepID=UPI0035C09971